MGRKLPIVGLFLVGSETQQLLDGKRRPMLVELAAHRRWWSRDGRRRCRSMVVGGREAQWSIEVGRDEDRSGTETERRRSSESHRRLDGGSVLRQTSHRLPSLSVSKLHQLFCRTAK